MADAVAGRRGEVPLGRLTVAVAPSRPPAPFAAGLAERYRRFGTLWILVPALLAMGAFTILFQVAARSYGAGGMDVLHLQKAFTAARFGAVVKGWGGGVEAFKSSMMMLDFAFPLLYAAGLGALVALAGGPGAGRAALWLFALPWAAAALDWVENLLHLWLLADVHTAADAATAAFPAPLVLLASIAAMLKYAALLAAAAGAAALALRRRAWWAAVVGVVLFAAFTPVLWA
jgi:hypothetical protein